MTGTRGRPYEGPRRATRVADDLWNEARAAAKREGVSTSAWVRTAIRFRLDHDKERTA